MSTLVRLKKVYNNQNFCKFMLAVNALIWASSYLFCKEILEIIEVGWFLAIRFICAAVVIYVIARKHIHNQKDNRALKVGLILGVFGGVGLLVQNIGLLYTTPGKNAFITGMFVIIVPFIAWVRRMGRPATYNILGALLATVGLGFIALDGDFSVNFGDALTLVAAFMFAYQTVEVSKNGGGLNILVVSFWEFLTIGLVNLIYALLFEVTPQISAFGWFDYFSMAYLILMSGCFAMITTNHAYTRVDPTSGSIISSVEAPLGVILSIMFGYEFLTLRLFIGFMAILVGVLLSETGDALWSKYNGVELSEQEEDVLAEAVFNEESF